MSPCHPSYAGAVLCCLAAPLRLQEDGDPSPQELEELSLEELLEIPIETVYGASKQEESALAAPSSVSVVHCSSVDAFGYRTLSDLLRGVRGVYVTNDRNYERLGIRGFSPPGDYDGRVLLLVDGHRTNEIVYDSALIGLDFPLDMDLVQRVEFVRGPGSSLYGSNAFFGVIDVRTKRGADYGGWELSGEAGTFDLYRSRVSWGRELANGDDVLLSGTVFTSDGPRLEYDEFAGTPSGGVTEGTDYEEGFSLFSQYARGPWRLQAAYVSREKGIPTGSYGTVFDDIDNHTLDERGWIELSGAHEDPGRYELRGRVGYDVYYYGGTYVYDDGAGWTVDNLDRSWGRWWGCEFELALLSLPRQRLTLGTELRDELRKDQANFDATGVYLDDEREDYALGVFAQDEVRLSEELTLSAGLRHDDYETFGGTTNPRLALVHADEESAWKLIYGTAFRPPNAYELYYTSPGVQKANPDLEPETIETMRASTSAGSASAAGAWRPRPNTTRSRTSSCRSSTPATASSCSGTRRTPRGSAWSSSSSTGSRMARACSVAGPGRAPRTRRRASAWSTRPSTWSSSSWIHPCSTTARASGCPVQGMDERRTLAGETDGFVRVDLALSWRELLPGLFASFAVENLFDVDYSDPVGAELVQDSLLQDGRTLLVRLVWRP